MALPPAERGSGQWRGFAASDRLLLGVDAVRKDNTLLGDVGNERKKPSKYDWAVAYAFPVPQQRDYSLSPNRRLPHQPRLGAAGSSAPVLETTGVGGGRLEDAGGTPSRENGAGSRMVERRRGGSGSAASCGLVSACGGRGASTGGA